MRKPPRKMPKCANLPIVAPSRNKAQSESVMEIHKAEDTGKIIYGKSGTKPEMKYDKNIIAPSSAFCAEEVLALVAYSSAEFSERKAPTAIENASTNIRTAPVRKIMRGEVFATAMPESSPTVETKLSSTPKTKFLKREVDISRCDLI
ncbi:MAG: hypothetical protein Q8O66_01115 [bacterium]|nr:hypothetical protein [bacterium]